MNHLGNLIRDERLKKKKSLRKFAVEVGLSPTYLSKIERGDFAPPSEEKLIAIAKGLGLNPDVLIIMSGKIPSDVINIIHKNPVYYVNLIRLDHSKRPDQAA